MILTWITTMQWKRWKGSRLIACLGTVSGPIVLSVSMEIGQTSQESQLAVCVQFEFTLSVGSVHQRPWQTEEKGYRGMTMIVILSSGQRMNGMWKFKINCADEWFRLLAQMDGLTSDWFDICSTQTGINFYIINFRFDRFCSNFVTR